MKRRMTGAAVIAAAGLMAGACGSSAPQSAPSPASPGTRPPASMPASSGTSLAPGTLVAGGAYARHESEEGGALSARLHGGPEFPQVTGFSEYSSEGGARDLHVSVSAAGGLAGRRVTVFVQGVRVGQLTISGAGTARGEWHTEHGQAVPSASAGSTVNVRVG